jgi:putative acetyltransferase
MLAVHRAAVTRTAAAAAAYDAGIIAEWAAPDTPEAVERLRTGITAGTMLTQVALVGGSVSGFGCIVPAESLLRTLYVDPVAGRRGIGSLLLVSLERLAVRNGVRILDVNASLNAEAFYRRNGFAVLESGLHPLCSGRTMPCIRMRKHLDAPGPHRGR